MDMDSQTVDALIQIVRALKNINNTLRTISTRLG